MRGISWRRTVATHTCVRGASYRRIGILHHRRNRHRINGWRLKYKAAASGSAAAAAKPAPRSGWLSYSCLGGLNGVGIRPKHRNVAAARWRRQLA